MNGGDKSEDGVIVVTVWGVSILECLKNMNLEIKTKLYDILRQIMRQF